MKKTKTKKNVIFKKLAAFIKHPFNRKNEPLLHTIEWVFILLAFFAVGLPVIYFQSTGNNLIEGKLSYIGIQEATAPSTEEQKEFIGETIEEPVVDVTGWDTYRNQWYGFEIKHPDNWTNMQYRTTASKNSRYETVYQFRKDSNDENDPYVGFDVAIYSTKKVASVDQTDDIQKKEGAPEDAGNCQLSSEMTLGEENIAFQKVSVSAGNACFEPTYFLSATNGGYLYDIIPVAKDGAEPPANFEQDANKNFPEYERVVSSLKFIPISRSAAQKTAPAKPRITALRPVSAKVVNGQLVCAKKNDHPSYSPVHKKGHMDMECCLDPDETPNPWCTYSNPKYQKFLK